MLHSCYTFMLFSCLKNEFDRLRLQFIEEAQQLSLREKQA
jgi:hypothetical protein